MGLSVSSLFDVDNQPEKWDRLMARELTVSSRSSIEMERIE